MRKAIMLSYVLLAFCAAPITAQLPAMFYDPFLVLPGPQGAMGFDAGVESVNVSKVADVSDVYFMGKYAVTDRVEAGARITMGFLNDGRDSFSDAVIGAKYGLGTNAAFTATVTVFNEAEEIGLAAGYMQATEMGGMDVNCQLQVGMLEGYAEKGVVIALRAEPRYDISEPLVGYLNVLWATNTDDLNGAMALDLNPNVDLLVSDALILNGGISVGLAGDMKQDDMGIRVGAIYLLP
jgi:hypothetical protein